MVHLQASLAHSSPPLPTLLPLPPTHKLTPSQFSIAGLSGGCTSTFAGFVFGDLSSCLQITSLLPVLNSDGNSSAIDPLNGYLTSLCASSTPICSNETLTGAATNIKSGCGTELQDRTSIPNILLTVLENYTPIRQAACSKNST